MREGGEAASRRTSYLAFLDTNVLLDAILSRSPWGIEASLLLSAIEQGEIGGAVRLHSLATLEYIALKKLGASLARR